jgi:PKD domain
MRRSVIGAALALLVAGALVFALHRHGPQPEQQEPVPPATATPRAAGFGAKARAPTIAPPAATERPTLVPTPASTPTLVVSAQQGALRVAVIAVPAAGVPPLQVHLNAIIVPLTFSPDAAPDTILHADRELQFDWDLGTGAHATSKEVDYTYEQPGTYQVTLTLTDKAGQTTQSTTEVRVIGMPADADDAQAGE